MLLYCNVTSVAIHHTCVTECLSKLLCKNNDVCIEHSRTTLKLLLLGRYIPVVMQIMAFIHFNVLKLQTIVYFMLLLFLMYIKYLIFTNDFFNLSIIKIKYKIENILNVNFFIIMTFEFYIYKLSNGNGLPYNMLCINFLLLCLMYITL